MTTPKLLIRDDGMLLPYTPGIAANLRMRPYHGDPKASKEDRLKWLNGAFGEKSSEQMGAEVAVETGAFDIGAADKGQLLEFAFNEFGMKLDGRKSIESIRQEVFKLAQESE